MHNGTFGPYLMTNDRIFISVMLEALPRDADGPLRVFLDTFYVFNE
jgi:hypothetical protein